MPDDAECLRRYAETRDEAAFAEFVRANVDLVYAAAYRQTAGDVHLAEDVTQSVFVAAAHKAQQLSGHPVIGAWLHQATRYAAVDAVRGRQRRQAREQEAFRMSEVLTKTEAPLDWDQIGPQVDQIIASLGDKDRDALVLRFLAGKSFAQIAGQLEVTENTARMRVDRALEKLRLRFARRGITSTVAALGAVLAEQGLMAAPTGLGASAAAFAVSVGVPTAGALASALTALKIMSTAKIIASVATVVAVVSLAAAVHEYQRAGELELDLASQVRPAPAPPRQAPFSVAPAPQPLASAASATKAPANAAKPVSPMAAMMQFLNSPAMQQQTTMLAKLRLDVQFGPLFKSLGLTPTQLEQFKNLLVEKQMVAFDTMSVARDQGIDAVTDPRAFFRSVASAEKTVDTQIVGLLGPSGYAQFQQYQATVPAHNTSTILAQALSYTPTPLTDEQANQVVQVLTQYGTPPLPIGNPFAVLNGDLGVVKLSDQGIEQLQGFLSQPQLQALTDKIAEQNHLLEVRKRMGH